MWYIYFQFLSRLCNAQAAAVLPRVSASPNMSKEEPVGLAMVDELKGYVNQLAVYRTSACPILHLKRPCFH